MNTDNDASPVILVVEDDRILRRVVVDVLIEEGYQALGAVDATEGLAVLRSSSQVTLLVTDINMPGMNGIELVELASREFPTLTCLLMSGREGGSGSALPPSAAFLQKPFSAKGFLRKVQELVDARTDDPGDLALRQQSVR